MQSHALWRPRGNSVKSHAVQEEIEASPSMQPQGTGSPHCEARAQCSSFPSDFNTWTWGSECRPKKIILTSCESHRQQGPWWWWHVLKAEQPEENLGGFQPRSHDLVQWQLFIPLKHVWAIKIARVYRGLAGARYQVKLFTNISSNSFFLF